MGNWSQPSKRLMNSFGVEIVEIPFQEMVQVLDAAGIDFNWAEEDNLTPEVSWHKWSESSSVERGEIAGRILASHADDIRSLVISAIEPEEIAIENVDQIELLLKTTKNEYHLRKFKSVRETIAYLLGLTADVDNIRGRL